MFAIELENLTKQYKNKTVLDQIDFCLEDKKTAVFLGLDNSGKTTLIETISLIKNINGGAIKYYGMEVSTKDNVYNTVSFMPNADGVSEHLTVFENLRLMARTRDYKEKDAIEYIKKIGEKYEIADRFYDKVKVLSKSYMKLVSFLMCVVSDAKILVLDEPFKDLDVVMMKNMINYIKELKQEKTIIITTELPNIALDLADDLYILKNAKINKIDNSISLVELENMFLNKGVE